MADTQPPPFKLGNIYVPQLESTFKISQSEAFDYYSTNSGMYPKNPGSSSGGGGGDDPMGLATRVQDLENKQAAQSEAAQRSKDMLSSPPYIKDQNIDEVEDIIQNQNILKDSQKNLLDSF